MIGLRAVLWKATYDLSLRLDGINARLDTAFESLSSISGVCTGCVLVVRPMGRPWVSHGSPVGLHW